MHLCTGRRKHLYGIVVHGGAGGTSSWAIRGCRLAAEEGMRVLRAGGSSLDAVVAAVQFMEGVGTFNAGVGSILRMDGKTIEMDAAVATSEHGRQGAVGAITGIRNPVLLARAVMDSRHVMLVGDGAVEFAQRLNLGLEPHPGPTQRVRKRYEAMRRALDAGEVETIGPGWTSEELERIWGTEGTLVTPGMRDCDTVGAVALDANGIFAVAGSTGGSGLMIPGRVGDVPVRGAGYEAGPAGGVLATGIGEEIVRNEGSGKVYSLLSPAMGFSPQQACEQIVALFPPHIPVGFIALTKEAVGVAANCDMASASVTEA